MHDPAEEGLVERFRFDGRLDDQPRSECHGYCSEFLPGREWWVGSAAAHGCSDLAAGLLIPLGEGSPGLGVVNCFKEDVQCGERPSGWGDFDLIRSPYVGVGSFLVEEFEE